MMWLVIACQEEDHDISRTQIVMMTPDEKHATDRLYDISHQRAWCQMFNRFYKCYVEEVVRIEDDLRH